MVALVPSKALRRGSTAAMAPGVLAVAALLLAVLPGVRTRIYHDLWTSMYPTCDEFSLITHSARVSADCCGHVLHMRLAVVELAGGIGSDCPHQLSRATFLRLADTPTPIREALSPARHAPLPRMRASRRLGHESLYSILRSHHSDSAHRFARHCCCAIR
jgi:hypothetical protein